MSVRRMASVYEFADRLIVMADHRNDAGFWQAGEPVIRLPSSADDESLGTAVRRAVDEAPAVVPATHWKRANAGPRQTRQGCRISFVGAVRSRGAYVLFPGLRRRTAHDHADATRRNAGIRQGVSRVS